MVLERSWQRGVRRGCLWAMLGLVTLGGCEAFGGETSGCTAIGCQSGLQVELQHTGQWLAGTYLLQISADDGPSMSCTVQLPFSSITSGASCSSDEVQLQTSGQALSSDQHALVGLWIRTTPAKVELVLKRDGTTVASTTLQPTYTTSRPNGPDCEPVCTQANAAVAVD